MPGFAGLTVWEKQNTKLFLDFGASAEPKWVRVGKSTVFDYAFNPETETFDFIEDATPTELLKTYKPSMAQEIYLAEGDPAFDELFDMARGLPVGSDAVRPALIAYPKAGTAANSFLAMRAEATISFNNLNTVDRKLSFDLKFANIENGTATFAEGVPTFAVAADAPA